eukprot:CAMPEP_0175075148 /NCGR_PEP_ID=MMETSP0052_2-20121109/21802_1 /TAXON_ID=51329 ORGANISM="Polytomella parva, Strain SAG 63-3" /NCGR_SAMPLE_ID=MMETSP0052_2 /ASSEMBLY_ACC=CAM_ASM_000194 /LENGTH=34 /DNA_ID= /DNA_START= /DNA_END= /DNA_ORIENTATION=
MAACMAASHGLPPRRRLISLLSLSPIRLGVMRSV